MEFKIKSAFSPLTSHDDLRVKTFKIYRPETPTKHFAFCALEDKDSSSREYSVFFFFYIFVYIKRKYRDET